MDVRTLLENTLPGLGYEFVALELINGGGLRLFIDTPEGITLDDCVLVSNHLTRLFAVENVDYDRLEVSSPGLDRPLTKEADYVRFAGSLAKIKTRMPLEGRKQFRGRLAGLEEGRVRIDVDGTIVEIPFSSIDKARLEPEF
ncbi:ribosome maturation factor RimP [Aquaspirillum soli]|jgi:ribosome maturation factor RimP